MILSTQEEIDHWELFFLELLEDSGKEILECAIDIFIAICKVFTLNKNEESREDPVTVDRILVITAESECAEGLDYLFLKKRTSLILEVSDQESEESLNHR